MTKRNDPQTTILAQTAHRPWPLPEAAWTWRQSWCDLLFAHWPISAKQLRALVPEQLELQEFDGTAWIALVPFRMEGVMHRPLPDLPGISAFPELNVRTYVTLNGKPGVWFLSLEATNRLAVEAAKCLFHLPYYHAAMCLEQQNDWIEYTSKRKAGEAQFRGRYRPIGEPYTAAPGTLEHWLTERYCLYAQAPSGQITCAEVHHPPWPLQRAEAQIDTNTMFTSHSLEIKGSPPLLHFAKRVDVVVWSPTVVPLAPGLNTRDDRKLVD